MTVWAAARREVFGGGLYLAVFGSDPAGRVNLSRKPVRNGVSLRRFGDVTRDDQMMSIPAGFDNGMDLGHGAAGPGTVVL